MILNQIRTSAPPPPPVAVLGSGVSQYLDSHSHKRQLTTREEKTHSTNCVPKYEPRETKTKMPLSPHSYQKTHEVSQFVWKIIVNPLSLYSFLSFSHLIFSTRRKHEGALLSVFFLFFLFCCEPRLQTERSAKPRKTCWTVKECKELWGLRRGRERENPLSKAAHLLQGRPGLSGNQELPPRLPSGLCCFCSLERKTDRWQYLVPPCAQTRPRGGPTEYTATGTKTGSRARAGGQKLRLCSSAARARNCVCQRS